MRIFLTGATGFLGGALLKELHARGHEVSALVRSPSTATALPEGVRVVPGSIDDVASHRAALEGHDALVHAAALVKMWARDRSEFDRTNVRGTEDVIRAAAAAGVRRIVHASSFMALGPSNGRPLTEDDPRRTPHAHNDYERTKILADQVARGCIEEGLPVWVLYPGIVYGPGNLTQGSIVARSVVSFLNGRMPFGLPLRAWSYSYVDDVVAGFVAVIEGDDPPSRRYVLGGDNRTGDEFYRALESVTGRKPPRINMPLGLAALAGWGEYLLAEITGREPRLLTHEVARVYRRSWAYDSSRAVRELGYVVTPLEEGLRRMVAWLRAAGHVR